MHLRPLLIGIVFAASASAADVAGGTAATKALTIALPAQSEITKLADLVAQFAGVSVQYNPQKVQGSVRLSVRGELTAPALWDVFNQVLVGQNLTTVVVGSPPVYQIVPIADAANLSSTLESTQLGDLPFPPGYAIVVHQLAHLGPEAAVKAIGAMFGGQANQARTFGQDAKRIVVAAPTAKVREALAMLQALDRAGVDPQVRLVRPERASAQTIQASATAAWTATGRIAGQVRSAEIQVAPDGAQILLIAPAEDLDALEQLVKELDRSEPVETRTYRPRSFGVEEVASLLSQVLRGKNETAAQQPEIIRDKLTGSLIVKATATQHKRIEELLRTLDDAPAASRRQMRAFVIRNRQADELAKVLTGLISSGVVGAGDLTVANGANGSGNGSAMSPTSPAATAEPIVPGTPATPAPGVAPTPTLPNTPAPAATAPQATNQPTPTRPVTAAGTVQDSAIVITSDVVTNRVIALGEPRALDQIATLINQLDKRQPQVDLDVILVTLSETQDRDLGVELTGQHQHGSISESAASLFGLSQPAATGSPLDRSLPTTGTAASGLGGVVLSPGDWSVVLHALESISNGRTLVRSHVVVNNNAKAAVNGVVQEPLTSTNSSTTVATTSVTGTSDAGTQIAITPTISVADYLTVAYTISQSAFVGDAQVIGDTRVPPTKRSDSVTSVTTIPDGHVIAIGGLSNIATSTSEDRVPWLGTVPGFGWLFKHQTKSGSQSRFFVFIRPTVLRSENFADLRHVSEPQTREAALDTGWPTLEPRMVK